MAGAAYTYIIIGSGLAGVSAMDGIRERDNKGGILLIGAEKHLPYDRPPLSKKLWFGKKKVEEIFLHDQSYYDRKDVTLASGVSVTSIDAKQKSITTNKGNTYYYQKLLLATGGVPRTMNLPGGDLEGIFYFRTLDDYLRLRQESSEGKTAVVVGGGFIGSELAAALTINRVKVTMIYPEPVLVSRVFPGYLGKAIRDDYLNRGVTLLAGEKPASFSKKGNEFITRTESGKEITSDMVVVGIGIVLSLDLPRKAGLQTANGIIVDEYLQTSLPDIYAAGDNAFFPYRALGKQMRVEHWDNALNQGKWAGRNMAGAGMPYTYMPYFFSDLFDFGYEAVGEVDSQLETFADWQKENEKGVIYYLRDGKVRGAIMCNVWDKVDAARTLIQADQRVTKKSLRGMIG
ncbi:MAG TPA: FAD-dependent oxidoreductase [Nitrospirota bacterium]|nr:FAD-dependent oxidoreductase [Nitrospirota bacterium]